MIELRLLGATSITTVAAVAAGRDVGGLLGRPKQFALLAYLAAATPRGLHSRDQLVALFWPEADQEHGRPALRKTIHLLRRDLGETALIAVGDDQLGCHHDLWCDVAAFDRSLQAGDLAAALELYRGDLLPGFFSPDSPGFERWLESERASLRARAAAAAWKCAKASQPTSVAEAVHYGRLALSYAPGDEPMLRWLMDLLDRSGDRSGAVRAYHGFAERLRGELELEPSPETTALAERLRNRPAPGPPAAAVPQADFNDGPDPPPTAPEKRVAPGRPLPLFSAVAAGAVLLVGGWAYQANARQQQERWVQTFAVPEVKRLSADFAWDSAYQLTREAAQILPGDSTVGSLWTWFSFPFLIRTEPAGATVKWSPYADTSRWVVVGRTPTDSIWITGGARIRIEMAGFRTVELAAMVSDLFDQPVQLARDDGPNPTMVVVPGGDLVLDLPGLEQADHLSLGAFLMERHESTNAEYRSFIVAGGYDRPEYWPPIIRNGRQLAFDEAMRLFKDRSGRPGPASWNEGDWPAGEADFPVAGLSWFEASAYAAFRGKSLPTAYHWTRAASSNSGNWIVPGSNYEGSGPARGSRFLGMSPFGTFDMAGNVREWCENAVAGEDKRYLLGGGWSDNVYTFHDPNAQDPFDRSPTNGVRLVKYADGEPLLSRAMRPLVRARRDYSREVPVSDPVFESFRRMYEYDPIPLNARLEARDTTREDWVREKVSFDAAYGGGERVFGFLFLPKGHPPPFQTVIVFPGSNALFRRSSAEIGPYGLDFVLKSGRAVLWPMYKSTFERGDGLASDFPDSTVAYRDHVLMWAKDLRRSIDYLVTRSDIDSSRLAYYGHSWGGFLGGLMPAVEPRLKTAVLYVAGLMMQRARPEVDPINFLPRINIPVLMLNGKYDDNLPTETSQKPMYRRLGTRAQDKRWLVSESAHYVPLSTVITETLAWLDRYLGAPP